MLNKRCALNNEYAPDNPILRYDGLFERAGKSKGLHTSSN